ncbi:hypothetical protein CBS115989_5502 [Aspergillus niger]|uniref:Contig An11c0010, genomic contig n=3 Tax=Aspergillus niger TaxID=5061 RepID=A5ABF2_ASPNC|nr:uncharacterized protein An11g00170 [Aspergillus niger]XP_025450753.1 uncharacterized protein BO96DRAFT_484467 [Aspergillus niger CBS 101883]RDH15908.1 hypothetical protein M747DRAFT_334849 [Aspergillus niger ATCC 13496]KAI2817950.1 hypothetical protein CBS115989_5502 [Aspergillus niger]KAI2843505.1 hypothetical protein CBS11232_8263 [Aspergillus niger]KAI2846359.1 hypothetical protein CBS12448_9563 [Aspergillus niger]KAI2870737.1 hypothetical protein CBS115988_9112 [Aspergillus niger]|eukprot:XP_001394021.1 hypothetical protein ANI_1_1514094 [Aspergillus niger CBS 513.88]
MRWTPENEDLLWRTIFETQTLNLDLDKIAEGWPGDDKPTAKALKEHLGKYRKGIKSGITFSMNVKRPADDSSATPSPKKRRAATKQKAKGEEVSDNGSATLSPRKKRSTMKKVKYEEVSEESDIDVSIPAGGKDKE